MSWENAERDSLIMAWLKAKEDLAKAKSKEEQLRTNVINHCYHYDNDTEGSKTINLGKGYKLTATFNQTYTFDDKEGKVSAACKVLNSIEGGSEIESKLVAWKPTISKKAYEESPQEIQELFSECLTIKQAKPTLKLKEPKKK